MSPVIIHHHHLHSHLQGESTADPTQLLPLPERLFVYEFEIHQQLVGLIIGKFGAYVNYIKAQTGASLLIKDHNKRYKLCAIEGQYFFFFYMSKPVYFMTFFFIQYRYKKRD